MVTEVDPRIYIPWMRWGQSINANARIRADLKLDIFAHGFTETPAVFFNLGLKNHRSAPSFVFCPYQCPLHLVTATQSCQNTGKQHHSCEQHNTAAFKFTLPDFQTKFWFAAGNPCLPSPQPHTSLESCLQNAQLRLV